MCISELGDPDMWGYVDSVVSLRTGSDESVARVICMTGPDGPVGGVTPGGTDKEGCHAYERGFLRHRIGAGRWFATNRERLQGSPIGPATGDFDGCEDACRRQLKKK